MHHLTVRLVTPGELPSCEHVGFFVTCTPRRSCCLTRGLFRGIEGTACHVRLRFDAQIMLQQQVFKLSSRAGYLLYGTLVSLDFHPFLTLLCRYESEAMSHIETLSIADIPEQAPTPGMMSTEGFPMGHFSSTVAVHKPSAGAIPTSGSFDFLLKVSVTPSFMCLPVPLLWIPHGVCPRLPHAPKPASRCTQLQLQFVALLHSMQGLL